MLQIVDYVLANAPAALREACSRDGILAGLERVGAFDVPSLRTMLAQDYAGVKVEIGVAARPSFVARLKELACAPRATDRQVQEVQAGWLVGGLQLLHSCVSQLDCLPWQGQGVAGGVG